MSSLPPLQLQEDILFAQKASSCVKAAGMDPRQMDLKRFHQLAAVIFTRAYLGIYKESFAGMIKEPQNDDDLVNNAQKVIEGLFIKTSDQTLTEVSGEEIVSGSHTAISVVVTVLYSEGNRLWLQKLSKLEENKKEIPENNDRHYNSEVGQRKMKKTNSVMTKRRIKKQIEDSKTDGESSIRSDEKENGEELRTKSEVKELTLNTERNDYTHSEDYKAIALEQIGRVRRKRPSSAPSRSKSGPRGRIATAQAAAVERLFGAGRHKEELDAHLAAQAKAQQLQPSSPSNHSRQTGDGKEAEQFTYDMKSGRRILMSQAYLDSLARQHKVEAMGNLKNASDMEAGGSNESHNKKGKNSSDLGLPPVPSRPEWPGRSTGASVDRWVKRMLVSRTGDEVDSALSHPRQYSAYQLLEKLDFVISIEHCFNCAHHSLSLRHDPNEYIKNANTFLRIVAQIAHENGLCARVGVTRLRARITSNSQTTDVDSRIGAFEVQVAFKNSKGDVVTELLHSKLLTRHWPSKAAMEKKIQDFVTKCGVATHPLYDANATSDGYGSDGLGQYPIGNVEWEDTPLNEPTWAFPTVQQSPVAPIATGTTKSPLELLKNLSGQDASSASLPGTSIKVKDSNIVDLNYNLGNCEDPESKSLNVQWVFDAREVPGTVPKPHIRSSFSNHAAVPLPSVQTPATPVMPSKVRPSSANATSKLERDKSIVKEKSRSKIIVPTSTLISKEKEITVAESPMIHIKSLDGLIKGSVIYQLKIIASRTMVEGEEDEPLIPYDGLTVVKKGVIIAETIFSCRLLRNSLITYCCTVNQGEILTVKTQEAKLGIVFQGLDRRKMGSLDINDIDYTLELMQNRKCSDGALKLIMLSLDTTGSGEISFAEFLNFVNHHQKDEKSHLFEIVENFNENEDIDGIDELGVLWLYLRLNLCDIKDGVAASTSEVLPGLDRLLQELNICVDDHAQDTGNSNVNGMICAQYVFLGVFVKSAVRSYLNTAQMSLLLNAFGVEDDMLNIYASNFMKWLSGEGVDDSDPADPSPADINPSEVANARSSNLSKSVESSESVQTIIREEKTPIPINDNMGYIAPDVHLLADNNTELRKDGSSSSRRSEENLPSSEPVPPQSSDKLPISKKKSENSRPDVADVENKKEVLIITENEKRIPDMEEPVIPYECRDLMFTSLIVEGVALTKRVLKQIQIIITIHGESYFASVSPAKERGTERVTFAVSWKAIRISEESFRGQDVATINLTADAEDNQLDVFTTTPLVRLMTVANSPFEVSLDLPLDSDDSVTDDEDKKVKITLIGVSRMCAADLLKVKFDPFPTDDDDFSSPMNYSTSELDKQFFTSPVAEVVSTSAKIEEVNENKIDDKEIGYKNIDVLDNQQSSNNDFINTVESDDAVVISKVGSIPLPTSSRNHESTSKTVISSNSSPIESRKESLTIDVESNDDTKNMYTEFQEDEASASSPTPLYDKFDSKQPQVIVKERSSELDIKKEREETNSTKQESVKDEYEEEYEVDFDEFLGDEDE